MYKLNSLTQTAKDILINKATETPNSGRFNTYNDEIQGTYLCRLCGTPLFTSTARFTASCGWPSFDQELPNKILKTPDSDGQRVEIICNKCKGHLGHIFTGEGNTITNMRYCVNSLSLDFTSHNIIDETEEAIIAGGCFWGIEYKIQKLKGVLYTEVGYTGGSFKNPSYIDICNGKTQHVEAVRIIYSPKIINFNQMISYFLDQHDSSKENQQGNDIGTQYQSSIFYYDEIQKKISIEQLKKLKSKGIDSTTKILPVSTFWVAEEYHQNYINKNPDRSCLL
jgi:peptide methionine sulfoxide reductase msrA/msrB